MAKVVKTMALTAMVQLFRAQMPFYQPLGKPFRPILLGVSARLPDLAGGMVPLVG